MSPEVAEQVASPWATKLTAISIAVGISAGLGACTPEHTPSATGTEAAGHIPDAACVIPEKHDPKAEQKAAACEKAMTAGSLVVVSFDAPKEVKDTLSANLSATIAEVTGNKVHVTTHVEEASPGAKAKLKASMGARGCIDPKKSEGFASTIADTVMPDLRKYNFVLGVSTANACSGVSGSTHNRDGDVFLGSMAEAAAHGHLSRGALVTAVHEFGHELRLGHYGQVFSGDSDLSGKYGMGDSFDLGQYLKTSQYEEYGGDNIMGLVPEPDYSMASPVQEAMLDWPQQYIPGSPANPKKLLGEQPLTFSEADCKQGEFGAIHLKVPVTLTDGKTEKGTDGQTGTHTFDQLAVIPRMANGQNYGVDLAFVDTKGNVIADLGGLGNTPGENTRTVITYGKQKIEISIKGTKTTIREL
jgi:hypothetical protein